MSGRLVACALLGASLGIVLGLLISALTSDGHIEIRRYDNGDRCYIVHAPLGGRIRAISCVRTDAP